MTDKVGQLTYLIQRMYGTFQYVLSVADQPEKVRKTCQDILDPVRLAGPSGNVEQVRTLLGLDASEERSSYYPNCFCDECNAARDAGYPPEPD